MPNEPVKIPPAKAETPVRWKLRFGRLLVLVRIAPKGDRWWRMQTAEGFFYTLPFSFARIQRVDGPKPLRPVFYGLFLGPFNVKLARLPTPPAT